MSKNNDNPLGGCRNVIGFDYRDAGEYSSSRKILICGRDGLCPDCTQTLECARGREQHDRIVAEAELVELRIENERMRINADLRIDELEAELARLRAGERKLRRRPYKT